TQALRRHRHLRSFPPRRSSDLHQQRRASVGQERAVHAHAGALVAALVVEDHRRRVGEASGAGGPVVAAVAPVVGRDRKRPRVARFQYPRDRVHHRLLLVAALELPGPEPREQRDRQQGEQPAEHPVAADGHAGRARACDNPPHAPVRRADDPPRMNDSLKTLLIVAFLVVILWNLGAGLYYMLVDKGTTKRTVNALTKRIALSVALILLVGLAIYMGWITPHGVGG